MNLFDFTSSVYFYTQIFKYTPIRCLVANDALFGAAILSKCRENDKYVVPGIIFGEIQYQDVLGSTCAHVQYYLF